MSPTKKIQQILQAKPTREGAGVRLQRVFGFRHALQFDPFLLLDDFHADDLAQYERGFPWHPHRGIETITYLLAGEVAHGDSLGNEGVIGEGDVQWMTAGSGIVHQEMPQGRADGTLAGFQLWANLPASHKMMGPRYRGIKSSQIPVVSLDDGVTVRVISGRVGEARGPVEDVVTNPSYWDVTVPGGVTFTPSVPGAHTVLAYVFRGQGRFDPEHEVEIGPRKLVVFGEGEALRVAAGEEGLCFLLLAGKPIGEPVAWRGPIVMNTQEELRTAFEEYRRGTFIK